MKNICKWLRLKEGDIHITKIYENINYENINKQ